MNLIRSNPTHDGIRVQTSTDDEATLYVYDVIDDWWGINAESFVTAVNDLKVKTLNVRINSPGGDVFSARAMQTALRQHPANVVVHIDGLAASAATFLAMAAREVRISAGAFFMIHNGWTFLFGNADELRKEANLLDAVDDSIANDYVSRTGLNKDVVITMMAEETWLSANDAVKHGFADQVINVVADNDVENRTFDLSAYRHPPLAYTERKTPDPVARRAHLERRMALIA